MTQKYPIGTKVVPIKKSIGVEFQHETQWKYAKENNQPFLYVSYYQHNHPTNKKPYYELSQRENGGGNHWLEEDFIPFVTSPDALFAELVEGKITNEQYERSLKYCNTNTTNTTYSKRGESSQ